MGYSAKKRQRDLLKKSLTELSVFAHANPKLPLNARRAIVVAIYKGGSLGNLYHKNSPQTPNSLNYQYTQQGLIRICLDKMTSYPETAKNLRRAIWHISALSAWAHNDLEKPFLNKTRYLFDYFAREICPEDCPGNFPFPVINIIERNFHRQLKRELGWKLGTEKALDFIVLSPKAYYKKYAGR